MAWEALGDGRKLYMRKISRSALSATSKGIQTKRKRRIKTKLVLLKKVSSSLFLQRSVFRSIEERRKKEAHNPPSNTDATALIPLNPEMTNKEKEESDSIPSEAAKDLKEIAQSQLKKRAHGNPMHRIRIPNHYL